MKVQSTTVTTWLGSGVAATEFASIDFHQLVQGDSSAIGHLVKAMLFAGWGWYTNRKGHVGDTVPVGTPISPATPVIEGTKPETK